MLLCEKHFVRNYNDMAGVIINSRIFSKIKTLYVLTDMRAHAWTYVLTGTTCC